MSEQTANLCTTDACESLRARLAKYEDAEGRPLQSGVADERAAFEARFSKVYGLDFDEETEEYKDPGDQALWYGWQARAALTASAPNHSEQVRHMVPEGFRVMKPTSAVVRDGDRWEIYAPCGSGGIVHEDDVTDWVVRKLLDAAATPSAGSQEQGE